MAANEGLEVCGPRLPGEALRVGVFGHSDGDVRGDLADGRERRVDAARGLHVGLNLGQKGRGKGLRVKGYGLREGLGEW